MTRRAPFGVAQLKDTYVPVDFAGETKPNDLVSIIATEPLTTSEDWHIYEKEAWKLWQLGEVIAQDKPL